MTTGIRLLAIDLDDTLLRDDNTVSAYTKDILKAAQAEGIEVLIATGRMYQTAEPVGKALGIGDVPMVLYSGGLVQCIESGRKLYEKTIPLSTARKVLAMAKERGWYIQAYVDDVLYVHHETEFSKSYEKATGATAVYIGDALYDLDGEPNKLLIIEEPAVIDTISRTLHEDMGSELAIVRSKRHFLELNPPQTSKGEALHFMAQRLGVPVEAMVAFGNSENDISMLKEAGRAIAVANAEEMVKAVADEVCRSNEDDGVAHWVATHVLGRNEA